MRQSHNKEPSLREAKRCCEARLVKERLAMYAYNVTATAKSLQVSRPHLYEILRRHNIKLPERKGPRRIAW